MSRNDVDANDQGGELFTEVGVQQHLAGRLIPLSAVSLLSGGKRTRQWCHSPFLSIAAWWRRFLQRQGRGYRQEIAGS